MRITNLLAAIGVLLAVTAASAQTLSDPISGTWTGDGGAGIILAFDGTKAVSGTLLIVNPGGSRKVPIKSGTFDRKSGRLRVEGDDQAPDGRRATFVVEASVQNDTLSGTYKVGNDSGPFTFRKASPRDGADDEVAAAVRGGFNDVSGYLTKAADLVPADKYTYRPSKDVRTVGQMLAHVVDGYHYFCPTAAGQSVQWSDAVEKGATDKATLTQKLKEAIAACEPVYAGKSRLPDLIKNNEHTNLHYGNLVTYMRMLGLTPPSS